MQKVLSHANDLADHDIIEEDDELDLRPLYALNVSSASSVTAVPNGRQVGSSKSFKDTSILGSAPLVAKLAQSISAPTQPLHVPRMSSPDCHVYASGNPVISTIPVRTNSAVLRKPRTSAPSGETVSAIELESAAKATDGKKVFGVDRPGSRQEPSLEHHIHGDIQGGVGDSIPWPRPGLLRRFNSLNLGSRPPSAKQEGVTDAAGVAVVRATTGEAKRVPYEPSMVARSSALPCVDVELEHSQLLRKLSLRDGPSLMYSKSSAVPGRLFLDVASASVTSELEPEATGNDAAAPTTASNATERPSTPLRRLSRLISGSLKFRGPSLDPTVPSDQGDPDTAVKRRPSSAGIRNLFSRPSSAKRKSEAGVGAGQQQPPMEAWKQELAQGISDGLEDDHLLEFGTGNGEMVRQPDSIIKRAANVVASALKR